MRSIWERAVLHLNGIQEDLAGTSTIDLMYQYRSWQSVRLANAGNPRVQWLECSPSCLTLGFRILPPHMRLRWSSGQHAGLWYPSSRVRTRPKPLDFSGVRINLSMRSFEGEVKESVPCPSFAACKRTQYFRKFRICQLNSFLPTHCNYAFYVFLTINFIYIAKPHLQTGFSNGSTL